MPTITSGMKATADQVRQRLQQRLHRAERPDQHRPSGDASVLGVLVGRQARALMPPRQGTAQGDKAWDMQGSWQIGQAAREARAQAAKHLPGFCPSVEPHDRGRPLSDQMALRFNDPCSGCFSPESHESVLNFVQFCKVF